MFCYHLTPLLIAKACYCQYITNTRFKFKEGHRVKTIYCENSWFILIQYLVVTISSIDNPNTLYSMRILFGVL